MSRIPFTPFSFQFSLCRCNAPTLHFLGHFSNRASSKGNSSLARVGPDGTVGWTVHGPEVSVNSADKMRPNGTLVLCRQGKVIAQIKSGKVYIEKWDFSADGGQLLLVTRGSHGPADIELHDAATGKLIESVKATGGPVPEWAKPYENE